MVIVINNLQAGGGGAPGEDIVPIGGIVLFYGTTIPTGYALCDGSGGRPDLRGKFVRGASSNLELLTTGGAETHLHSESVGNGGSHNHGFDSFNFSAINSGNYANSGGSNYASYTHYHTSGGGSSDNGNSNHSHSPNGLSSSSSSLPSHKLLYWIQRIS